MTAPQIVFLGLLVCRIGYRIAYRRAHPELDHLRTHSAREYFRAAFTPRLNMGKHRARLGYRA